MKIDCTNRNFWKLRDARWPRVLHHWTRPTYSLALIAVTQERRLYLILTDDLKETYWVFYYGWNQSLGNWTVVTRFVFTFAEIIVIQTKPRVTDGYQQSFNHILCACRCSFIIKTFFSCSLRDRYICSYFYVVIPDFTNETLATE